MKILYVIWIKKVFILLIHHFYTFDHTVRLPLNLRVQSFAGNTTRQQNGLLYPTILDPFHNTITKYLPAALMYSKKPGLKANNSVQDDA